MIFDFELNFALIKEILITESYVSWISLLCIMIGGLYFLVAFKPILIGIEIMIATILSSSMYWLNALYLFMIALNPKTSLFSFITNIIFALIWYSISSNDWKKLDCLLYGNETSKTDEKCTDNRQTLTMDLSDFMELHNIKSIKDIKNIKEYKDFETLVQFQADK